MSVKQRPRLGRGLSSLISVSDLPVEREISPLPLPDAPPPQADPTGAADVESIDASGPAGTRPEDGANLIRHIPLDAIVPNPRQPRRTIDEGSLRELAASLKETGLIQPVAVRQVGEQYELIAGERRWRAAQLAGLATLPAIVKSVDALTQAQMALVENIQRENLNAIDRALAYRSLMAELGLTQAELAARLGEDRSSIANYLRLLDLNEPIQILVLDGRLSMGHAKLLAGVPDILEQARLANLVVSQDLSVRNLERLVREASAAPAPPASPPPSAHLQDLEKHLSRQLGLRVQLRTSGRTKTKGSLTLHYATLDQFDELLNRLGVNAE